MKIRDEWYSINAVLRGKYNNFFELIHVCFAPINIENADLFCIMIWRIWFCRNSRIYKAKVFDMAEVVSSIKNFLFEFRSNNPVKRREEATGSMIRHRWDPLNEGDYKANCDSVIDSLEGRIGFGYDCGLSLKVIESDEATVVRWIKDGCNLESDIGPILAEISNLRNKMNAVTFHSIHKDANKVANGPSINALEINEDTFWMEEFPPIIKKYVEAGKTG
ncbi:hypothetical protein Ddye_025113 [Dipteronia dyeriana]|uniref:RNase H type-1 domain-containing protein n=1 Tax=Dipteronia dyeriana TaxID=168575 RepID=A0AAD9WV36_9ROSI|nr:hypothetical protein Ddye_025113 [Dipteronia dyeriana]